MNRSRWEKGRRKARRKRDADIIEGWLHQELREHRRAVLDNFLSQTRSPSYMEAQK
jgi:SH3-like domain-containing protein